MNHDGIPKNVTVIHHDRNQLTYRETVRDATVMTTTELDIRILYHRFETSNMTLRKAGLELETQVEKESIVRCQSNAFLDRFSQEQLFQVPLTIRHQHKLPALIDEMLREVGIEPLNHLVQW